MTDPVEVPTDEGALRERLVDFWAETAELDRVRAEVQATQLAGTREQIAATIERKFGSGDWTTHIRALAAADAILSSGVLVDADKIRAEQREADAVFVERWADHYPSDIFIPGGTSMDAHSADVIRVMVPNIAAAIRSTGSDQ